MNDEKNIRLHAVISGRVQGVGFRGFTATAAQRSGITGWVRNRINGTVEAVAEGDQVSLEVFLREISKGPGSSYVDDIEIRWLPATGEFESFKVRWTG
ncbi:MAG: acylphosphatase [Anaerolineales bacterium]|nr:acylphosphatase [Anaerolineales bacterium]